MTLSAAAFAFAAASASAFAAVVAETLGIALAVMILTPLFQINLDPDFMQVYLIPFTVEVEFSFEHELPAVGVGVVETLGVAVGVGVVETLGVAVGVDLALAFSKLIVSSKMTEQRTDRNAFALLMD
jgi:hypothetical protein